MSWRTVALGDVCAIEVGRTPSRANPEFWGEGHKWLSIADMAQGETIFDTKEEITASAIGNRMPVTVGTVLLSFKLSIGRVARAGVPLFTNEAIAALPIHDRSQVDPQFLLHTLKSIDLSHGSNRAAMGATLNKRQLQLLRIPLPPLEEQRRIAAILDQADEIRVKRRAQLTHLDELPQSLFQDLLHRHASLPTQSLQNILKWKSGKFLPASKQVPGSFPVYGGNGINGTHHEYSYSTPQLIIGRVGAHCGVVHITQSNAWVTDNALIGTFDSEEFSIEYLSFVLKFADLNQYAATSGQPSISAARIAEVKVPLLRTPAQQEFSECVLVIQNERARVARALEADNELFAALQYRAFRGEL